MDTLSRVGRVRLIGLLGGAAVLLALCVPASALAGTYTWKLASDFTATAPGANPDHDQYGGKPWSYVESQSGLNASHDPATFSRLTTFATAVEGGLAGWSDPGAGSELVGVNPTGATITNGGDSFAAGQAVLMPPSDRLVAVGWTSPLAQATTVEVTGTITADDKNALCAVGRAIWSLDQGGSAVQFGAASSDSISKSLTVSPGGSIYLTVSPGAAALTDPACAATGVQFQIAATQSSKPKVTLSSPASGALISGTQPTFSGGASGALGASSTVTVRVYDGGSTSGTPVETLRATRSGAGYSVDASPPLADGQYTAQAEQDDLSSPPDKGFSVPVTFTVHNAGPQVKLDSPGTKPLLTATPTLTGTAGTAPGDSSNVTVSIYSGTGPAGSPARVITTKVRGHGRYSAKITPALPDGQYTAVAQQSSAGSVGTSRPQSFQVKLHAPVVTIEKPVSGASTNDATPTLSGAAGTATGDSPFVTVQLYKGSSAKGRVIGTMQVRASGSQWSGRWRHTLDLGLYTARAKQTDDAGHTGYSKPHTFQIVPGPSVIGSQVTLDRANTANLAITCIATAGGTCTGTVLVVTAQSMQAVPGGPSGQIRVLFAYVRIAGGQTAEALRGPGAPCDVSSPAR
jgi:hypothetical protein